MIVHFDHALHDHDYEGLRETLADALANTGIEVDEEFMDKVGRPFYEVQLLCTLDTDTGSVTIQHADTAS